MENFDNILERLMAGESAEVIAAEFTDALNKAQSVYDAKTAEAKTKIEKTREADALGEAMTNYINKWHPALATENIAGATIIEMFDNAEKMYLNFEALLNNPKANNLMTRLSDVFDTDIFDASTYQDSIYKGPNAKVTQDPLDAVLKILKTSL